MVMVRLLLPDDVFRRFVRKGRDTDPDQITLQTRTLRYGNTCHWLQLLGLVEHWRDARLEAKRVDYTHSETLSVSTQLVVTTNGNVTAFSAAPFKDMRNAIVIIDGERISRQSLAVVAKEEEQQPIHKAFFRKQQCQDGSDCWEWVPPGGAEAAMVAAPPIQKTIGLQGPIDDAFMAPFIVVTPNGHTPNAPQVDAWVEFELAHFLRRCAASYITSKLS